MQAVGWGGFILGYASVAVASEIHRNVSVVSWVNQTQDELPDEMRAMLVDLKDRLGVRA